MAPRSKCAGHVRERNRNVIASGIVGDAMTFSRRRALGLLSWLAFCLLGPLPAMRAFALTPDDPDLVMLDGWILRRADLKAVQPDAA
jgi:hypothetical protein